MTAPLRQAERVKPLADAVDDLFVPRGPNTLWLMSVGPALEKMRADDECEKEDGR